MADFNIRDLSDDELKKVYNEHCEELDRAEDNVRVFLEEIDRRKTEKDDNKVVPVKLLKSLLSKWDKEVIASGCSLPKFQSPLLKGFLEELKSILTKE